MTRIWMKYLVTFMILAGIAVMVMDKVVMPVYVRKNQNRYLMNVKNRPLDRALAVLASEGFKGQVHDTLYTNNYKPMMVVDQYPDPNTRVKPGRTIRLKITQPEKMVVVPNLIGRSLRSAELELYQLGLAIDTVYKEYNPDYPMGTVAWQSPKGGDVLKKGHGLHLTTSEGMPPNFFQVPQLFGLSKSKAEEELARAGLTIGKVFFQQNEDLVPYTVLDQSISAGTVLEREESVNITVSVLDIQDIFNQLNAP